MRNDTYGQLILSEDDLCELYLKDPNRTLKSVLVETGISFDTDLDLENLPELIAYTDPATSVEKFDQINQKNWLMPDSYKQLDIAKYVLDLCETDEELQRVGTELLLFQKREMFDLLRYMKYLVDTMRKHNVVWGVGRGSSVSSYVLFLIGVHRINSLYYDLSIDEFLK